MGPPSLGRYVVAVAIVWAALLVIAWFVASREHFDRMVLVGGGFAIGMLAMYIATGIYGR